MDERERLAAALEQLTLVLRSQAGALAALDAKLTPAVEFLGQQEAEARAAREDERVEARVEARLAEALGRLGVPAVSDLPSPWHQNRKLQGAGVSGFVAAIVVAIAKLLGVGGGE